MLCFKLMIIFCSAAAIFRNQASGSKPAPKAVNQARPQQTPLSSIGQDLDRSGTNICQFHVLYIAI